MTHWGLLLAVSPNDVALAGIAVGGIGAVAGLVGALTPLWLGSKTRQHERDLARDERLYPELQASYAELLERIYEFQEWVGRSFPRDRGEVDGPPAAIAQHLGDEVKEAELRRAFARASTVASEEVASALKSMEEAFLAFWVVLGQAEHGAAGALQLIKEARKAFDARVEETEAAIRGDVRR